MCTAETSLEQMMCRVLGDLIQEGCVTKLADDLYYPKLSYPTETTT